MANKQWKPGEEADKDLELYVLDSDGNQIGEISVTEGNRVPPTRLENAVGYVEKQLESFIRRSTLGFMLKVGFLLYIVQFYIKDAVKDISLAKNF